MESSLGISGKTKGYYLPIEFKNGEKGWTIRRLDTDDPEGKTFGNTDDTDTTMILIYSVDPAISPREIRCGLYENAEDAQSDSNGKYFTIDYSQCQFDPE